VGWEQAQAALTVRSRKARVKHSLSPPGLGDRRSPESLGDPVRAGKESAFSRSTGKLGVNYPENVLKLLIGSFIS